MYRRLLKRLTLTSTGALLLVGLATAPTASAQLAVEQCPAGQVLARLEEKTCPNGIVVKRACCQKNNGTIHCKHFPKCPKRSPS